MLWTLLGLGCDNSIIEIEREDRQKSIIDYIEHGKLPNDTRHRTEILRRAPHFVYYKNSLYHHPFDGLLLFCFVDEEASKLEEAHSGICCAH